MYSCCLSIALPNVAPFNMAESVALSFKADVPAWPLVPGAALAFEQRAFRSFYAGVQGSFGE